MPRVTYEIYRQRHLQLRQLWEESQGVFAAVDPMEQWDLHDYFLCTDQPTEVTLRSHYDEVKDSGSSLPQRAGKAYAELVRGLVRGVSADQRNRIRAAASQGRKEKVLTVRSLVRPRIDVDEFVRTLMSVADKGQWKD